MSRSENDKPLRHWCGGRREEAQDAPFLSALDGERWRAGDADNWDACWYTGMPRPAAFSQRRPGSWVNHIPGNNCLTIKSALARTLSIARARQIAEAGPDSATARRVDFFPETFPLPDAYHSLQAAAASEPAQRWILKPRNSSRGRGISILPDAALAPADKAFMVQRYLDRPHTIRGHKYVLRFYVAFTSLEPLRVYLYEEGFAKLASHPYAPDDITDLFSHLTNPDVNATNTESDAPVVFIPMQNYSPWLREQGHDDDALFARVRDLVRITTVSAREYMRRRSATLNADTRRCFELIGLDVMVDADLKPWILECNLSPSLDVCAAPQDGGAAEAEIKPRMVRELVDMMGFNRDAPDDTKVADPAERIVAETREEHARAGGWQPIAPTPTPEDYLPFLPLPRAADIVAADAMAGREVPRPVLARHRVEEIIDDDTLWLHCRQGGKMYRLNDTAAWIWLQAVRGADPDAIAADLVSRSGRTDAAGRWDVRRLVWDQLADWVELALLRKTGPDGVPTAPDSFSADRHPYITREVPPAAPIVLRAGKARVRVDPGDGLALARLRSVFAVDVAAAAVATPEAGIAVLRRTGGYALSRAGEIVVPQTSLATLAPRMCDQLFDIALAGDPAFPIGLALATLCLREDPSGGRRRAILVAGQDRETFIDPATYELAEALEADLGWGAALAAGGSGAASALGLPVAMAEGAGPAAADPAKRSRRDLWSPGLRGHLLAPAEGLAGTEIDICGLVISRRDAADPDGAVSAIAALGGLVAALRLPPGEEMPDDLVSGLHEGILNLPRWTLTDTTVEAITARIRKSAVSETC
ncbi:hypothetical protein [Pararhodobacter sp. SW119]|uniref:hypothetical protein n=1 Tax=Pararhodobacter sp. SW119 TaxID=2780075 RepID=UPI001AE07243|nr:hypothetical protein [Pararhodobacter sp. SW119]